VARRKEELNEYQRLTGEDVAGFNDYVSTYQNKIMSGQTPETGNSTVLDFESGALPHNMQPNTAFGTMKAGVLPTKANERTARFWLYVLVAISIVLFTIELMKRLRLR